MEVTRKPGAGIENALDLSAASVRFSYGTHRSFSSKHFNTQRWPV